MPRKSITLEGFGHGDNPIPAASRIGPLLVTGGVHGVDRKSGALPADPIDQIRIMFENLACILEVGGATMDDVARLTVYIGSIKYRSLLNVHWVKVFPNEASRPARHTLINPNLPSGMHVQCNAIAYVLSPD